MVEPNYDAKSYYRGGWQWYRNDESTWVIFGGSYLSRVDGAWWLMGKGEEIRVTSGGIKEAIAIAVTEHAAVLSKPASR